MKMTGDCRVSIHIQPGDFGAGVAFGEASAEYAYDPQAEQFQATF